MGRRYRNRDKYYKVFVTYITEEVKSKNSDSISKKKWIHDLLAIVSIITAIAAVMISYCTLMEMQNERRVQATPNIVIEPSRKYINMDVENGEEISFNVYNIGAGVANNIIIIQDENNMHELNSFYCDGEVGIIANFYKQFFEENVLFLLPEAKNSYLYILPQGYSLTLFNLTEEYGFDIYFPNLGITIEYEDYAGNIYKKYYEVNFRLYQYMPLDEGMNLAEVKVIESEKIE